MSSSSINLNYGAHAWKKKWHTQEKRNFCVVFFSVGILVNGQLVGAKRPKNKKLRTYFGKLGFYFQSEDVRIEVSTENITLSRGSRTSTLSWSDTARVTNPRQVPSRLNSGPSSTHHLNKARHPWQEHRPWTSSLSIWRVEAQENFRNPHPRSWRWGPCILVTGRPSARLVPGT